MYLSITKRAERTLRTPVVLVADMVDLADLSRQSLVTASVASVIVIMATLSKAKAQPIPGRFPLFIFNLLCCQPSIQMIEAT